MNGEIMAASRDARLGSADPHSRRLSGGRMAPDVSVLQLQEAGG